MFRFLCVLCGCLFVYVYAYICTLVCLYLCVDACMCMYVCVSLFSVVPVDIVHAGGGRLHAASFVHGTGDIRQFVFSVKEKGRDCITIAVAWLVCFRCSVGKMLRFNRSFTCIEAHWVRLDHIWLRLHRIYLCNVFIRYLRANA